MDENFAEWLENKIQQNTHYIETVQYKHPAMMMRRATKQVVEEALKTDKEYSDIEHKFMVVIAGIVGECRYLGMNSTEALEVVVRLVTYDPREFHLHKENLTDMLVAEFLWDKHAKNGHGTGDLVDKVYQICDFNKERIEDVANGLHAEMVWNATPKKVIIVDCTDRG